MMSNQDHVRAAFEAGDHSSKKVEQLLAHYVERLTEGELLDPDEIRDKHPEIADALLPTLELFVDAGPADNSNEPLGAIGDYTLRRQIGRGGMGVVYEAWENSMNRTVALKVLPAGVAADSKAAARFLREAQTAGKLSHPSVVPVYFTGVREQTPFYAMEYVEGETLARILARVGDAGVETETPFGEKDDVAYFASLARAFADVADGLQHAHATGVVHRDIKPSNLILDRDGRLRILDFGLARLEGEDSLTRSGDFVGTPLYMSPEQARRRKIRVDHRTDVYSLGATLYEALCGRPPFRGRDHADTLSQIVERDPVEPRKLNARVPRDLETIVLKCLRKEAADRYGTAEALAQDLRRFVRGDPVEAAPPSRLDRVSRRLWRHRWLLLSSAGVLAVLVAGLVVALLLLAGKEQRTQEALTTAREDFARARGAVDQFLTLLAQEELAVQPGMEKTRLELLESALDFYRTVHQERGDLPGIRQQMALAHRRLGLLHRSMGKPELAEAAYRDAVAIVSELSRAAPENPKLREEMAESWTLLALLLEEHGRVEEARPLLESALDLREELAEEFPDDAHHRMSYAMALGNMVKVYLAQLGSGSSRREDLEKALDFVDRSLVEYGVVLAADPDSTEVRYSIAMAHGNAAIALKELGEVGEAEKRYRKAIEAGRELIAQHPADVDYRALQADHFLNLGVLLNWSLRKPVEAEKAYRESLALRETLAADFPETPDHRSSVGAVLNNIAQILIERGDLANARELTERAIREQSSAVKDDPGKAVYRDYLSKHYWGLAWIEEESGRFAEAVEAWRASIRIVQTLLVEYPSADGLRDFLASQHGRLAGNLEKLGRIDEADAAHRTRVAVADELARRNPTSIRAGENRSFYRSQRAAMLARSDRFAEAVRVYDEAIRLKEELVAAHPGSGSLHNHLGDILLELAGFHGARDELDRALELTKAAVLSFEKGVELRAGHARYENDLREGYRQLVRLHERRGEWDEAARVAELLAAARGAGAADFYESASTLARCAGETTEPSAARERRERARELLAAALEGDPGLLERAREDPALAALRARGRGRPGGDSRPEDDESRPSGDAR